MRTRKVTAIALSAVFASAIMLGSANRAEAHRGWGWGGIGVGAATALILGGIYHHRHRHGYYYGGYPSYSYGYYPAYRYGYYRPRYQRRVRPPSASVLSFPRPLSSLSPSLVIAIPFGVPTEHRKSAGN